MNAGFRLSRSSLSGFILSRFIPSSSWPIPRRGILHFDLRVLRVLWFNIGFSAVRQASLRAGVQYLVEQLRRDVAARNQADGAAAVR